MAFILRNIILSTFILALVVGSVAVYLSGRTVYEAMLNQIFNERIAVVETVGRVALENTATTSSSSTNSSNGELKSLLTSLGTHESGVLFFRVVDTRGGEILMSADSSEEGNYAEESLPRTLRGETALSLSSQNEQPIVNISYLGSNNRLLWMAVEQSFFLNPAIVTAVEQAFLLIVAFGIFGILFYFIIKRFFLRPVRQLKSVLGDIEERPEGKKEKRVSQEHFGELLESLSDISRRIELTIEHDKVISQSKSDFISTTAHQLRTPLSGINWALGALMSSGENLSDEQKTLVQRSLEKTKELVAIVGELLSAAGIEQGKFGFHREEVFLKEEIEKTLKEEKEMASKNNIALRFEHVDEPFPAVYVDRERIRWVIRNLIENAIRYGKDGGEVVISLVKDRKRLMVSVKDDGIGITPDDQQHIFEKFFRSAEARRKRNDGSGLGLYIVKNIVNYHGGRIWFESVEGVGTTFFFTVPLAQTVASSPQT